MITNKKERKVILLFLFFPLLLLLIFGLLPFFSLVSFSFTSWNGLSDKVFLGFDNYLNILTTPKYYEVFRVSLYYFISGLVQIVIAFYFATLLTFKTKFKNFFKASFVYPSLISGVAISMIFKMFLSPDGTFDFILTSLGLESLIQYWLGNPKIVNFTLASISLWRHTGVSFIMFIGAIQAIPDHYYKLVDIEGGQFIEKVRYIILPNIYTVLKINFILLTIGALSVFEIPMIMTNGSNGTETFLLYTMKTAFEKKYIGLASSMAIIITIVIVLMTIIPKKVFKNNEYEY